MRSSYSKPSLSSRTDSSSLVSPRLGSSSARAKAKSTLSPTASGRRATATSGATASKTSEISLRVKTKSSVSTLDRKTTKLKKNGQTGSSTRGTASQGNASKANLSRLDILDEPLDVLKKLGSSTTKNTYSSQKRLELLNDSQVTSKKHALGNRTERRFGLEDDLDNFNLNDSSKELEDLFNLNPQTKINLPLKNSTSGGTASMTELHPKSSTASGIRSPRTKGTLKSSNGKGSEKTGSKKTNRFQSGRRLSSGQSNATGTGSFNVPSVKSPEIRGTNPGKKSRKGTVKHTKKRQKDRQDKDPSDGSLHPLFEDQPTPRRENFDECIASFMNSLNQDVVSKTNKSGDLKAGSSRKQEQPFKLHDDDDDDGVPSDIDANLGDEGDEPEIANNKFHVDSKAMKYGMGLLKKGAFTTGAGTPFSKPGMGHRRFGSVAVQEDNEMGEVLKAKKDELRQLKDELSRLQIAYSEFKFAKDQDEPFMEMSRTQSRIGRKNNNLSFSSIGRGRSVNVAQGDGGDRLLDSRFTGNAGASIIRKASVELPNNMSSIAMNIDDTQYSLMNKSTTSNFLFSDTDDYDLLKSAWRTPRMDSAKASVSSPNDLFKTPGKMNGSPQFFGMFEEVQTTPKETYEHPLLKNMQARLGSEFLDRTKGAFENFSTIGSPYNAKTMELSQFHKFLSEHKLYTSKFTRANADLMFCKTNKTKSINFPRFCEILYEIASQRNPKEKDPHVALDQFMNKFIFVAESAAPDANQEAFKEVRTMQIKLCFETKKQFLMMIFNEYRNLDRKTYNTVLINDFLKFCTDFKIIPQFLTKPEVAKLFQISQRAEGTDSLNYDQFCDCLGLVAIKSFSKAEYADRYPQAYERVEGILHWLRLQAQEKKNLGNKLQRGKARKTMENSLSTSQLSGSFL